MAKRERAPYMRVYRENNPTYREKNAEAARARYWAKKGKEAPPKRRYRKPGKVSPSVPAQ